MKRWNFVSALAVFGLSLSVGVALVPLPSAAVSREKVIQWHQCPTQLLKVTLNVDNESTKKDLVGALQALSEYPELKVRPAYAERTEVSFHVSGQNNCRRIDPGQGSILRKDQAPPEQGQEPDRDLIECVVPNGWTEVQWRLKAFKGVSVTCSDEGEAEQDENQNGGVSGDN